MLNDDVLLSVLSRSSRQTAASMMATCHFLYHEGAKVILRDWPVAFDSIASEHKALSLLRFIQAEHFSRCSYVRKLYVSMQPMPAAIAQSLAGLVPRMTSLISLFLNIEQALESHRSLLSGFASLRSVKDLVVNGSERSCELIQSLQSQLVSVQLYFSPYSPGSGQRLYLNAAFHPLIMLQRSVLTLKALFCGFWCDMDPRIFVSLPNVWYPNMHTLTLYECRNPQGLSPYIKSFPSLAHLIVEENGSLWDSDYAPLAGFQRNMNLAQQGTSSTGGTLSWKQLHDYTGRLVDLWFLGLSCPISRLRLEDTPTERPPHALTDVLGYARPTELTIAFRRCSLTDILKADFLGALCTGGASGMRRLTFLIELRGKDRDLDMGRALGDIGATISRLNLTHLDIRVNDDGLGESEEAADKPVAPIANREGAPRASASASEPLSLGERTLEEFDVDAFIWRLLGSIRTLQDTLVSIQSPCRCGGAMRGARVKTPGLGFPGDGWESEPDQVAVLCKEVECVKESDDAWWSEIAALNIQVNNLKM
ncbi:hypothetical protein LXA43DRAFT_1182628 [Ganoderma leucocontextum]|nr:hypothetical protein LXA43DRAFT_1182628 [Ganoderma leucocontextum]